MINNTGTYVSNTSNTLSSLKAQNDAIVSMEGIDPKVAELGRKISLEQAKRLLAIASIRPSKTFHKLMTEEEMDALTKYYNLIKPKASVTSQAAANAAAQQAAENARSASHVPITYQSSKVNLSSLRNLQSFIDTYKKEIDSGRLTVDYDLASDPKGFVLKDQTDQSVIKFPQELNDSFFALAVTHGDQENKTLSEANLYRIVNWNDTSASCFAAAEKKKTKSKNSAHAPKQREPQETLIERDLDQSESSNSPRESPRDSSSKSSLKENSLKDGSTNEGSNYDPLNIANNINSNNVNKTSMNIRRFELDMIEGSVAESDSERTASSRENDEATIDESNQQINSTENLTTTNIMVSISPKKKKHLQLLKDNYSASHLHSVHFSDLDTKSPSSSSGDISKNCENSKSTLTNLNTNTNNLSSTMNDHSTIAEFENMPNGNSKFKYSSSSYTINNPQNQQSSAINSSTLSFDYIKSLSSLVNSIIEPKLLKQLTNSGVDIR